MMGDIAGTLAFAGGLVRCETRAAFGAGSGLLRCLRVPPTADPEEDVEGPVIST